MNHTAILRDECLSRFPVGECKSAWRATVKRHLIHLFHLAHLRHVVLAGCDSAPVYLPSLLRVQSLSGVVVGYFDKPHGLLFLASFGQGAMRAAHIAAMAPDLDDYMRFRFDVTLTDAAQFSGAPVHEPVTACVESAKDHHGDGCVNGRFLGHSPSLVLHPAHGAL